VSTAVPPVLTGLVDDAAVFPPGSAPLPDALAGHARHRAAWYAALVGPLLVPSSAIGYLRRTGPVAAGTPLAVGLVGDGGLDPLAADVTRVAALAGVALVQVEVAVAKRGEDPAPGLAVLLELAAARADLRWYAELPLTFGLLAGLDTLAAARARGVPVAAKFRTGGLAAELFPTPVELAAVVCACRDRALPFKLTAGLHRAVRHADPETGFVHHGFLNVLAAALAAHDGAEVADVAVVLATTDPAPLVAAVTPRLSQNRPLWIGYGSCSVDEPLADLTGYGLIGGTRL